MRSRRTFITRAIGLAAAVGIALAAPATAQHDHQHAKVGQPAPEFTLKDTAGKDHKLSDHKGKIVVLQWINPDCPWCLRVMSKGVVKHMLEELKALDKDLVYLTVNSTHYMEASKTAEYLATHKIEAPALIDQSGSVGHIYGARTTPHTYVIDAGGILRYQGAIDDDHPGKKGKDAMNYVVNAVKQIKAGETVSPDSTKPYGCAVKYKR